MEFMTARDHEGGVTYEPWTDGYAIGFKCTRGEKVEYIYLNPSQTDPECGEDPTVFLYHGETGEPWADRALVHVDCFVD